ncbi:T-cell surface glycoprotein CD4-like [Seriola aureovittata]|uniref:T-cell surface glycoprotein CD4-like n=1 Tax=Seriola aureovittata TaxID=2871759 RepID=UPI0024BEEEA6|nr:T-cell surface glycoprotein CD4-like [Seriola aureovittata]
MKTIVWLGFVLSALSAADEVIKTRIGQSVTLKCGPNPPKGDLSWLHGSVRIFNVNSKFGFPLKGPAAVHSRSKVKSGKDLEITGVKREDAGKFTCMADGKSVEYTLLVVSVSATSTDDFRAGGTAILQCDVNGLGKSPEVEWKRPNESKVLKQAKVNLSSVAPSDAGTWVCTFSHKKVTYSEDLVIEVKGPSTEAPKSSPTQSSKVNPKSCLKCGNNHQSGSGSVKLSWWMWVAVGVGCLVVILLVVFVIVLCKKIRRRKKKLQRMKNGRQSLRPKQFCQCNRPTAAGKPQQGRKKGKPSALPLQPLLKE